jgi:REP element-mobilizing transposase RayT
MSSTHSALFYHLVFGTKNHLPTIDDQWRSRLHEYLGGLVRKAGGVAMAIGGVADHIHLLVSLKPSHKISALLRDIKRASSLWIHTEISCREFGWQEGYGAFTVSRSLVSIVQRYIERQEEHHRVRSFREEYLELLKKHGVDFNPDYLW